jgi:hypothetical protein
LGIGHWELGIGQTGNWELGNCTLALPKYGELVATHQ